MTDQNPAAERIRKRKENAVDPETFLSEAGAIQPTDNERELEFTTEFTGELKEQIEAVQAAGIDEQALARLFGVDLEQVTEKDRPYTAWKIRNTVYNWPSADALVFDVATDETLRERTESWADVPPRQRYRIVQSLRSFQDECLFCSGPIVFNNDPVESCCSERRVLTIHCGECGRRFLEFTAEDSETKDVGIRSG